MNQPPETFSERTAVKEDDEEVEASADHHAQQGQKCQPAVEHTLQAERKRHGAD